MTNDTVPKFLVFEIFISVMFLCITKKLLKYLMKSTFILMTASFFSKISYGEEMSYIIKISVVMNSDTQYL